MLILLLKICPQVSSSPFCELFRHMRVRFRSVEIFFVLLISLSLSRPSNKRREIWVGTGCLQIPLENLLWMIFLWKMDLNKLSRVLKKSPRANNFCTSLTLTCKVRMKNALWKFQPSYILTRARAWKKIVCLRVCQLNKPWHESK